MVRDCVIGITQLNRLLDYLLFSFRFLLGVFLLVLAILTMNQPLDFSQYDYCLYMGKCFCLPGI